MKNNILSFVLLFPFFLFSQVSKKVRQVQPEKSIATKDTTKTKIAPIDLYRIISLDRDTTYIDTSLTIRKEYSHNFLRKDNFGLLLFPNEGQTFNTLNYSLVSNPVLPEMGFMGKYFNFIEANQVRYASVATPVTELFFKTTIDQGQAVDSYFTINVNPNLNFSIAYRGMRSLGRYINQLSSIGNFRFTTSYHTKDFRYIANAHYMFQDILNGENGGITTLADFEGEDPNFDNRARLEVFLTDAKSMLIGRRIFLDHEFRINPKKGANNLLVTHRFNYENKFYEYNQATVGSFVGSTLVDRFGESYVPSGINDQTKFNSMYNKAGVAYENNSLGRFQFFVDDFRSNYYYFKVLILNSGVIPSSLNYTINSFGGQYEVAKDKWQAKAHYTRSLSNQSLSDLNAKFNYNLDDDNQFSFEFQSKNKLPNNTFNLYQSSYVNYNWFNNFKNEKTNTFLAKAETKWVNVDAQYSVINDYLYFADVTTPEQKILRQQIVAPKQFDGTINYLSIKASREFTFGKFALDNTVLYQKVTQNEPILNVPELVLRNAIYFSDSFFKNKALFLQTGFVFNYFSSYYANDYNPMIGDFFVQSERKIGNFPLLDFFVNAKVQRTRIYLKAEHFNALISRNNYFSAPNTPYRDFTFRFGLIWNFFN